MDSRAPSARPLPLWRAALRLARACAAILAVSAAAVYASDKGRGGGIDAFMNRMVARALATATNVFPQVVRETGYAATRIGIGEVFDFQMPTNAVAAGRIARRGAHDDGFWLRDSFTNAPGRTGIAADNPVWIHTDGTVGVRTPSPALPLAGLPGCGALGHAAVFAPRRGCYGFPPERGWTNAVSRIWTAVTDRGSRVVTWEGALAGRCPDAAVSFQAEFLADGDIAYRYGRPLEKTPRPASTETEPPSSLPSRRTRHPSSSPMSAT